jgi:sulfur carrier protein ThiS
MKVFIEKTNKNVNLKAKDVQELLSKLKINPTTVLVVKNGEIALDNEKLSSNDKIRLLSVVSGG